MFQQAVKTQCKTFSAALKGFLSMLTACLSLMLAWVSPEPWQQDRLLSAMCNPMHFSLLWGPSRSVLRTAALYCCLILPTRPVSRMELCPTCQAMAMMVLLPPRSSIWDPPPRARPVSCHTFARLCPPPPNTSFSHIFICPYCTASHLCCLRMIFI